MVIPGYSIGFNQNTLEYKIHLTNDVDSVNINTIPNYERATVSISNSDNLTNGDVIAVEVTSADETSKTTYKIFITKDAPKKDYSTIIIIALLALALIGTIVMFIVTNNKKKSDPLLSIKTNKRKINKGKNFDASVVPESSNSEIQSLENNSSPEEQINDNNQVNTLNLNAENTVAPTQTDKIVVDSFNQATSVNASVDLTTNLTPTQVTNETQSEVTTPVVPNNQIQDQQNIANIVAPVQSIDNTYNQTNQNQEVVQSGNEIAPEQNIANNNAIQNNQNIIQ